MIALNIFQNTDGSIAWLNIALLLVLLVAGYFIGRSNGRKTAQKSLADSKEWQSKLRQTENEYKSYKSGHEATFKQHEKTAADMTTRVKALEGDIKAMADEKNKLLHRLQEKEDIIKNNSRQISDMEDKMKMWQVEKESQLHELSEKLKHANDEWAKAKAWEGKVHAAEEDARKSRNALAEIQRRTVEFDLRLKAASEYAAKVQPLEGTIKTMQEQYSALENELRSKTQTSGSLEVKIGEAQSTIDKLMSQVTALQKDLDGRQQTIGDLETKLKSVSETASRMGGLEAEIKTLKDTNASLQKELAERLALLMQFTRELDKAKPETAAPGLDADIISEKALESKTS